MNNNNLVLKEILDIVKNLSIKVDKIEDKVDKIEDKVDKIEDKVDKIENEIIIIKKDINSLKDYRIEVKSYQNVNAKEYEKEITKWLYNYLINNNYSVFFYIPSYEELPRDILNIDNESKKLKTITDLDGVIISTNINPTEKKNERK
jgi:Mg2+ and Co2+ transporter CorA